MATPTVTRRRKHAPAPRSRRAAAKPRKRRHFLLRFWWVYTLPVVAAVTLFAAMTYVYNSISIETRVRQEQTSFLYDSDGKLLTQFSAGVDRTEIPFRKMPKVLIQAALAAEDDDFFTHSGVDLVAVARAAWANFTGGGEGPGGSTITQQYVRTVFPEQVGTDRTVERKIREVLTAIKLEQELEKDEILQRYLNTVYFGQSAYGVEAAAQTYYRKPARKLNVVQSATLAGVIAAPSAYDPVDNPGPAKVRRDYVLGRMADLGFITEEKAEELMAKPIKAHRPNKSYARHPAAYYIDYARRYLERNYGERTFRGGFEVEGTIDMEWQQAAETAVANHFSLEPGTPAVSLVAMDVKTGEVKAMVGGRGFAKDQTNLATGDGGTGRQSGSAFKSFTLLAAIEQDVALSSTFSGPSPIDMSDKGCGDWTPSNAGGGSYGTMDLTSATASSVNTIFAQLVAEVGPENVAEVAHRMGIRSPLELDGGFVPCSITLGTLEVSPLEMTGAYATFASGGVRRLPTPVHKITGPNGRVIEENDRKGKRVVEQNDAWQAVYAMQQVVCCGTAAGNSPGFPVFGKTGTTDDQADVWFCGASTEVATCVWVGHPEGRVPMPGTSGGGTAAPIWREFMIAVHQGLNPEEFPTPDFTGEPLQGTVSPSPSPSPSPTETEEEPKPKPSPKPSPKKTKPPKPSPPPTPPPTTPPGP